MLIRTYETLILQLTIDVDYTKLVNIAGNKGVNPVNGSGVVTLDQITPGSSGNLLDSVAPTPVFAAGQTEYEVSGNQIIITYSEALTENLDAHQNLRDTDFTITRISNNAKLNPITEYDAEVVGGNTIVITLTDTRTAATAYTVAVKDAKYFTDASGNEIADSTGKSKLVASSASNALDTAKAAATTATTNANNAKTAHTTAGANATDAEYVAVTNAATALATAVASNDAADIEAKTTALQTATNALKAATTAFTTANADAATAKTAARDSQVEYILAGGAQADQEYKDVADAITALDAAVTSKVTADIEAATSALETATDALVAATAGL